ncbi:GGDEF domain-containing protein [Pseudoxanthomonas sp.]|uniref:GGDEF domain-containing protein n=1 Tax=Pseudoxanthomonas sp. TaxID=1871049 RepID=UPI002629E172|nr:GGDEF domain-containing protein [Pseudoxanthomonas sp.]WDS34714.1 MAG: GGDEF domain-containing protein [Pseudoxanthomonas sp.]
MPPPASRERFIHSASLIALSLTVLASGIATLIPWLSPVRQPMDLVIPPVACSIFLGLLATLIRRPPWVAGIMRTALLTALVALAAPAWFFTWQAAVTPNLLLIDIYPPVTALFLALMVMVMIYLPPRPAFIAVLLCWLLVALPVLLYLLSHPQEMHTPRGADLLMAYGPVFILIAVLLPVQRGLTGRIQHLVSEQARMEIMVNHDPLTRLYNRRFGEQVLQDMLAGNRPGGVIMFDMDRFKAINDTHGHPVGDAVLQRVAQRCQELVRKDECLARWGGEEFLIALPGIDHAGLKLLAERLRGAITELTVAPVQQISASIGATLIQHDDTYTSLLQRVDQALYRAKQQGGNVVMW